MNSKRVYLLTEGGKSIGFGHVTRNLSIYQAFEENGIRPELIINGDSSIRFLLKGKNYRIINWLEDRKTTNKLLRNADILIVDSYLAGKEAYEDISRLVKLTVYIDDNNRLDYPKGIVVNTSINANRMGYRKNRGHKYLLGIKYAPLRKEFWTVPDKKINNDIKRIMVTFGGDDSRRFTLRIVKLLFKISPDVYKSIIIGKTSKDVDELKRIQGEKAELIFYPTADKMRKIMLSSDLAISSGGQTIYELAKVGVPAIVISVADNQLNNVKGWEKVGFIAYAGSWNDEGVMEKVAFSLNKWHKYNIRKNKYGIGRSIVDGQGSRRIIKEILREV